jgi:hypothetical protein
VHGFSTGGGGRVHRDAPAVRVALLAQLRKAAERGTVRAMAKKLQLAKQLQKKRQKLRLLDRHPPRLGHETMMAIPAFRSAANALIERLRVPPGASVRLVSESDLAFSAVDEMLQVRYALLRQLYGWSHEQGLTEVHELCTYLATAANHALAGKKTFWVSAELAGALRLTNLDIPGDALELPFAACAYVFNDAPTLELMQALIREHASHRAPC